MDIIKIHSYTFDDKKNIFKKYLLPEGIKNTGL